MPSGRSGSSKREMNALRASWTPDPFATQFERRADGSLILRPLGTLAPAPARLIDYLEQWARMAPDRIMVARRGAEGRWIEVTYADMLRRVRRVAAGLPTRGLSAERPVVILSGNGIEDLVLAMAAIMAGIPYCPVSPAYPLVAGALIRLRYVLDLLTPGLVAAFDTSKFARALARVGGDVEIVGDAPIDGREVLPLASLERDVVGGAAPAAAKGDADSTVRFLLTSGYTGNPKAVIITNRM